MYLTVRAYALRTPEHREWGPPLAPSNHKTALGGAQPKKIESHKELARGTGRWGCKGREFSRGRAWLTVTLTKSTLGGKQKKSLLKSACALKASVARPEELQTVFLEEGKGVKKSVTWHLAVNLERTEA